MTQSKRRILIGMGFCALLYGCGPKPNAANIELRRQMQEMQSEISTLKIEKETNLARIKQLESGQPTVATLPQERLSKLFVTNSIRFGKITGGLDSDPAKPGHEGVKIHLIPVDEAGDYFKAAGSITIEAFDLAQSEARIGKWEFSTEETRKLWNGTALLYDYVINCPWQTVPQHDSITIKATFTDELTGRSFAAQTIIQVKLPS